MVLRACHQVAVVFHRLLGQLFQVNLAELGPQVKLLLIGLRGVLAKVVFESVKARLDLGGEDAIDWELLKENGLTFCRRDC